MKKIFTRVLFVVLIVIVIVCNAMAANIFTKTAYEEFYRYHDFANWLQSGEVLSSQIVTIYEKNTGAEETTTMISGTSVQTTKVLYKIKAGIANKTYMIKIKVITNTGQKFEDQLECKILASIKTIADRSIIGEGINSEIGDIITS